MEVRKVVAMAGVDERRVANATTCSSDLCLAAAEVLLDSLQWSRESVSGLIMVTQTPDYFMPSSSCVLHKRLGLSSNCAAFDLGLGCSGYVYGLWLAATLLKTGGLHRVLLLHGETPTRYTGQDDRAVSLLFGDAGSATALEYDTSADAVSSYFALHTDGTGYNDLIIEAGGFRDRFCTDRRAHNVKMNGASVFNFTIKAVPPLIEETLRMAGRATADVDYYVLHQSNRFIINHLISRCSLPPDRVPVVLDRFGNSGGPSVPLAITQGLAACVGQRSLWLMLLGYGAGLSWGAALVRLPADAAIRHVEYGPDQVVST
jgi:3-oxoacyl-[acyl-carrier-protein] synthase-3